MHFSFLSHPWVVVACGACLSFAGGRLNAQSEDVRATLTTTWKIEQAVVDGLSVASDVTTFDASRAMTLGDGDDQIERLYSVQATLSGSGTATIDVYDFSGARDRFGRTYAMARIKAWAVANLSTNTIRVGNAGGAKWTAWCPGDVDARVDIMPLGLFVHMAPRTNGLPVSDGVSHLLQLANLGSTTSNYQVVVIGSQ